MARPSLIPYALENRLYEWANWESRLMETSSIGYPNTTMEGKLADGVLVAGSSSKGKSPEVIIPRNLRAVDTIVNRMPRNLQTAMRANYSKDSKVKPSKHNLQSAHYWLLGALQQEIVRTTEQYDRLDRGGYSHHA
jgi:hypothetical protein